MGQFLVGILLPLLLLTAALLNWSLISLIDLLTFLFIQYATSKGHSAWRHSFVSWYIIIFSLLVILSHIICYIIWAFESEEWSSSNAWWAALIGVRELSMRSSPVHVYYLVVQLLVAFVALLNIYWRSFTLKSWRLYSWGHFSSSVENIGSHLRVACCLLLPVIQLIAGISHPSWISLPFFICSCVGLVDWSLTSNFSGLFRWWRPLLIYAGFNIVLLYIYQLPVQFPYTFQMVADIIGLYKVSVALEWPQICCSFSLLIFYFMVWFCCSLEVCY
ncbi:Piezo-type mechanosensitive ion channel-like protein [Thalictrum thalictroides]|uniref:Piezo-type mechanosensitive ion channel-like protein n=1 Tax=Thalictrum thalictroides TaxID=46969 RepID=A0A7J6WVV5_THATH|nr:Piezo-type mechanosensitive ion channel-like protein [Thalictrum thalictroides]